MQTKFNWRMAFYDMGGNLSTAQRCAVIDAIESWSDWHVMTEDAYITRIEDSDEDGLWDYEWDSRENWSMCFSHRFLSYMDKTFGKQTVVIGNATKLPLPVASPPSSSKGAVSSSSF